MLPPGQAALLHTWACNVLEWKYESSARAQAKAKKRQSAEFGNRKVRLLVCDRLKGGLGSSWV